MMLLDDKSANNMLVMIFLCFASAQAQGSLTDCKKLPRYVTPEDTAICSCTYRLKRHSKGLIHWRGPKGNLLTKTLMDTRHVKKTVHLFKANISKADDGYAFNCYFEHTLIGTYTPHLAYGPSGVTITGSRDLSPADRSDITLTCSAKIKPEPQFNWTGHPAEAVKRRGSTCDIDTFSSTLTFDAALFNAKGYVVRCIVTNVAHDWHHSSEAILTVSINSKPQPVPWLTTIGLKTSLAVAGPVGVLLLTSWILVIVQCRKSSRLQNLQRNIDETQPEQNEDRRDGQQRRDSDTNLLLHLENPSPIESPVSMDEPESDLSARCPTIN